ncbi:MAG: rod shape-determining protein RodA [Pyramidobacter sp.]|uniref:rod shape-determining protein RodA n=1 Tax=Pyramidobacter sp. TaxID=1943581 RepID=UPI002A8394FC|nr:rod shape-determining protein RodA [Pyramidobacter sp.]MDY4033423.1 rod shape-determining protein RodA [Pyramidobacter sp.]
MNDRGSWRDTLHALDYPLLIAVGLMYLTGVATIYSAGGGPAGLGRFYAGRQLIWGAAAVVMLAVVLRLDYEFFLDASYWLYGGCCLMLVLLFVMGHRAKGAQSWINLGFFKVQPAEFVKLGLAFVMAHHLTLFPPYNLKNFAGALALGGVSALLVLVQPDLGSTLVYGVMIFVALLVAGAPKRYLLSLMGGTAALLPLGWMLLKEYQRKRILVFINPELDPLGAGYNVIQSRIAVGSGRFFGKGFMQGAQSKLRFLPEPHTDFIFSVFAEEFGLVGGLFVLALLSFILWRMIRIALRARSVTVKVLVASLSASLWFHSFESIGMSMGLLPVTGLPLPLMSYGGSSLLATVLAIGVTVKLDARSEISRRENSVPDSRTPYSVRRS